MSFNNLKTGEPYAIHLKLSSDTVVSSGSAIPYSLLSGTTGHGVTVSSGVVSLPEGEWICNFTVECTTSDVFVAQLYVDGIANTVFPTIQATNVQTSSNMDSTTIPLRGPCTIELRPTVTKEISEMSDLLIFGVKA